MTRRFNWKKLHCPKFRSIIVSFININIIELLMNVVYVLQEKKKTISIKFSSGLLKSENLTVCVCKKTGQSIEITEQTLIVVYRS